jgi:hypothetical protein
LVFKSARLFMKLGSCSQLSNFFFCLLKILLLQFSPFALKGACLQKRDLIAFLINLIWF